jgi:hypothetical protein
MEPIQCFMVEDFNDLWKQDGAPGELNVGAMIFYECRREGGRPEQPHLRVVCPDGIFCMDCPESSPPYGLWTRTGEAPNITLTPSIFINKPTGWHGWLREGKLVSV